MDVLDRLLRHDAWTTRRLLDICTTLTDPQLDREFDVGHRSLRATFHHIISNMEVWSAMMNGDPVHVAPDRTIAGLQQRLAVAADRLERVTCDVRDRGAWDETWIDVLDRPPRAKSYGTGLAHIVTHSMHHRAQVLYLLRLSGVRELPEGDVFSWEAAAGDRGGD